MPQPAQLVPYAFKPGNPGRPPGSLGDASRFVKAAITGCFEDIGGYEAFVDWAKTHPTQFYTKIWPKMLPSAEGLPDDDKMTLLKAMLAVPKVMTQMYEGEIVANAQIAQESQVAASPAPTQASSVAPQSTISPSPDSNPAQPKT